MTVYKAKQCNLKEICIKTGITFEQISSITGITKSQLSSYANNKIIMRLETAMSVSKALNCSVEELYGWETQEKTLD